MSWHSALPLLILASTLIPGLMIFCVPERREKLRTTLNLVGILGCISLIGVLVQGVYQGEEFKTRIPLLTNMDLVLHADTLSLLFISLSGILWGLTTIYAIGYLKDSPNRSRFFGFFSLCVFATMGVALAGNLITFLIFYELLTLTTYPLVAHKGNPASLRAARIYLIYTMIGGALLLAGVVWLKALAGSLDFVSTGVLEAIPGLQAWHLKVIFVLLITGLGVKAALVPFHGWLPVAMAAPAPVSALLHAVAVVKAGAFGIVRVVYDVYGIEFTREMGLTFFLAGLAALTIVYGSMRALFQDDLKKRLAYSTISQVSYIALGTAIAGPLASIGGIVHLVHQGLMKITMFFCAGNLAETLGIHRVSELNGVGRRMPLTMAAFTLASLGMIGIPPLAGFISKWYLGVGAIEAEAYWVLGVLAISSLLNAAYLLPILYATWFKPASASWPNEQLRGRYETHWMLLLPPLVTAALAAAAGIFAASSLSPLNWAELIAEREYGLDIIVAGIASQLPTAEIWLCLLVPLCLAIGLLFQRARKTMVLLAPLASLPAVLVALFAPAGDNSLSWLFFGSVMGLDDSGRVFLLLAGLLWLAAGIYALDYLKTDTRQARFFLFYLLAMAGNFGLILAQDIFGFITFFTLMSLAAYGLVVHTGTDAARRAGKTYIQWVVLGEVVLFAALAGLVFNGASSGIGEDPRMLSLASQPPWVTGLLLVGFGIKTGLFGLHVWLPRAHPVAPVPASALLSGIMVKAGLLGWLGFLPLGEISLPNMGATLTVFGLLGTFFAALIGITQRNPKALLAYSTISQMGIMTAAIGVGLMMPELWPLLLPALLVYAVHHGVTKAGLFLSVGVVDALAAGQRYRWWLWSGLGLLALTMAGLPLSGGAAAKISLKAALSDLPWLTSLLSVSAILTTLLMLRFLDLLAQSSKDTTSAQIGSLRWLAFLPFILLAPSLVYLMPLADSSLGSTLSFAYQWSAIWPLLLGLALYFLLRGRLPFLPTVPAGDAVFVLEYLAAAILAFATRTGRSAGHLVSRSVSSVSHLSSRVLMLAEPVVLKNFARISQPGMAFIGVAMAIALALTVIEYII